MTVLKVLCITSCIGGLMPIVASSESFQPIEESLTDFFAVDETHASSIATSSTFASQEEYDAPSSNGYVSAFSAPRQSALELLDNLLESPHQASMLPEIMMQGYVDNHPYTSGSDSIKVSTLPSSDDHTYPSASQQAHPLPQIDRAVESTHHSKLDHAEIEIPKSQNIASAIAHLDRSLIALPAVEVVSAPAKDYGKSVLHASFQLQDHSKSSQRLVNVTQCSLSMPHPALSDSDWEDVTQSSGDADRAQSFSQVTINGTVVAEFAAQGNAYFFAEAIKAFIKSDFFLPHELEVRPNGDSYMIATQDSVVTQVSPDSMPMGYDSALVAIAWTNNLRVTLGAEPLSMGKAQAQIQSLKDNGQRVSGVASWYGPYFHGRLTASGEYFDQNELTAAHPTLPFDTYLNVTNLKNGRTVVVRINDRGPYIGRRSLDLSRRAAQCLDSEETGVVPYTATLLEEMRPEETHQFPIIGAETAPN